MNHIWDATNTTTPTPTGAAGLSTHELINAWMLLFGAGIPLLFNTWCIWLFYVAHKYEGRRTVENLNLHLAYFIWSFITCLLAVTISLLTLTNTMDLTACNWLGAALAISYYYSAWVQTFTYVHMTLYLGSDFNNVRVRRGTYCALALPLVITVVRFAVILSNQHKMKLGPEGFCTMTGDHKHVGVLVVNLISVVSTIVTGSIAYWKINQCLPHFNAATYRSTKARMYVFAGFALPTALLECYRAIDGAVGSRGAWGYVQSAACFLNFMLLFLPLPVSFLVGERWSVPDDVPTPPPTQYDTFAVSMRTAPRAHGWRFSQLLDELLPGGSHGSASAVSADSTPAASATWGHPEDSWGNPSCLTTNSCATECVCGGSAPTELEVTVDE